MRAPSAKWFAILIGALVAQPIAAMAEDVTIVGCPEPGAARGCIVMLSPGGLYDVSAARPTPAVGVPSRVSGTITTGETPCGPGNAPVVSPATSAPAEGIVCWGHSLG